LRPDVVLQILVQDMQRMTEAFSISLLYRSTNSAHSKQKKLKEISESWNKSNRRGHGHYTKKPESIVMMNLTSALVVSSSKINDNLSLPDLSAPNWLNVTIGLLLSITTIRQSPPQSTIMQTSLLIDVANFIENWILASGNTRCKKKTNAIQKRLLNTDFDVPPNIPIDPAEQSVYLLHNLLLPMIAQPMLAIKTYLCTACKFLTRTHTIINYIPINVVNGQILIYNELITYFISSTSDVLCNKCSFPMTRRIELLDCKYFFSCLFIIEQ